MKSINYSYRMNSRDLQYLVAVAEYQHFGKAAQACFVSQPALSMQLSKLEESLGVQLFERTNKKVFVTEIGQQIIDRAKKILHDIDELKEIAAANHQPFSGKLKLGVFPTLAPYLLPRVVPLITKKFPAIKLFLIEEKTDPLLEKLGQGEIDLAMIALPVEDEHFECMELFIDPFFLAVAKNHPLAKLKRINASNLQDQSLLLLEDGHCLRDQALSVCERAGVTEQQDFRASSLETLRQMVAANIGVTLIPEIAKKNNDGVCYIPFKKPIPSRTIGLVWRKSSIRKELFKKIGELIGSAVES